MSESTVNNDRAKVQKITSSSHGNILLKCIETLRMAKTQRRILIGSDHNIAKCCVTSLWSQTPKVLEISRPADSRLTGNKSRVVCLELNLRLKPSKF